MTIPFIAIFGLTNLSIRIPQALFSIVTIIVFYFFCKKMGGVKRGLLGMLLLTIMPWHIMMSRWGLESNILPGMLLLGIMFAIYSLDNTKYLMGTMILLVLALYAYSAAWAVMPIMVFGIILLMFLHNRKLFTDKYFWIGSSIFLILALPLILFVLINIGLLEEINTPIISIPRFDYFRGSEVSLSLSVMIENLLRTLKMLLLQDDGLAWNSLKPYGFYYLFSIPFIIVGIIVDICDIVSNKKIKNCFVLIWFFAAFTLGMMISVNANRLNIIHITMIYYLTLGIEYILSHFNKRRLFLTTMLVCVYCASFFSFIIKYADEYNSKFSLIFHSGLSEALAECDKYDKVYINDVLLPEVLVALAYPTDQLLCEAKGSDYSHFDKYYFFSSLTDIQENIDQNDNTIALVCPNYSEINTELEKYHNKQYKNMNLYNVSAKQDY